MKNRRIIITIVNGCNLDSWGRSKYPARRDVIEYFIGTNLQILTSIHQKNLLAVEFSQVSIKNDRY
jgi:hypothetical protein